MRELDASAKREAKGVGAGPHASCSHFLSCSFVLKNRETEQPRKLLAPKHGFEFLPD